MNRRGFLKGGPLQNKKAYRNGLPLLPADDSCKQTHRDGRCDGCGYPICDLHLLPYRWFLRGEELIVGMNI
ncbi:hypothetical protein JCM6292_3385 [Bacteroides pyogenes JCM 6292]|uniref:Uncharacterized protein n=2 Tax=Bacteroides pyogenes TaxID=310300 RepID=W4PLC8_9BACE|nr:hypothetical protein JCM6292_3385 [Bacteroides pyogenes JCM 6292]GAE20567.1 hypothetical protein JCM6294_3798 [Bacteroides pyogenes DSM 20611 = JCM 6294]